MVQQVELRKHSRLWKWKFRKEKALLRVLLGGDILGVEHVGSTSVPGLIAKPIIDIVVMVSDFEQGFACVHKIERLGYKYLGENDQVQQYEFIKGTPARYHLYVHEQEDDVLGRISFRDCLLGDQETAAEYAALKRTLAVQHAEDIRAYQAGKRDFIETVVRHRQWMASQ